MRKGYAWAAVVAVSVQLIAACGSSGSGVAASSQVAALSETQLKQFCQWAFDRLAGTKGTTCDQSIPSVESCVEQLGQRRGQPSCGDATVAALDRCVKYIAQDPCIGDLKAAQRQCLAAAGCIAVELPSTHKPDAGAHDGAPDSRDGSDYDPYY